MISDGRRIYLTGYSSITALEPFKPGAKPKKGAKGKGKQGKAKPQP